VAKTIKFSRRYTDIRGYEHQLGDVHVLDDEAASYVLRDDMGVETREAVTGTAGPGETAPAAVKTGGKGKGRGKSK
jgi:hypothetical protein